MRGVPGHLGVLKQHGDSVLPPVSHETLVRARKIACESELPADAIAYGHRANDADLLARAKTADPRAIADAMLTRWSALPQAQ